jgi:hypothetical protein
LNLISSRPISGNKPITALMKLPLKCASTDLDP